VRDPHVPPNTFRRRTKGAAIGRLRKDILRSEVRLFI
jgi:hypothetical protein